MKNILSYFFLIIPLITFSQVQIGIDIDGEAAGDNSGHSVSLSSDGSIIAIGAPYNNGIGSNAGHVRVYENQLGIWIQLGSDIDGEFTDDSSGWRVSLSDDGSIIAIGAPYNGLNIGHVRVYENILGVWTQLGSDIDGEATSDQSGRSVSLSSNGNIVAIGAISNNSSAGHVRIYEYNSSTTSWIQLGSDIDGEAAGDNSGWSVSLSDDGSIIAIGAPNNIGRGHVRVYENILGVWTQIGSDIDGKAVGDKFGRNVSLSSDGSILAIGAYQNDNINGGDSGHVRIYKYNSGTTSWNQLGADINGEAAGDNSGYNISLSSDGRIVAIGAYKNDGTGSDSGHVRIYQYVLSTTTWTQIGVDINGEAPVNLFGNSVSLSSNGSIVAIGAPTNNGTGIDAGHVRVYDLSAEVLGISDEFVVKNFSIYPNPVSTNLYIQITNELEFISVSLFDYLGKSVLKSTKTMLDVSSLSEGMYFLKVETDKGIGIKKVIIN